MRNSKGNNSEKLYTNMLSKVLKKNFDFNQKDLKLHYENIIKSLKNLVKIIETLYSSNTNFVIELRTILGELNQIKRKPYENKIILKGDKSLIEDFLNIMLEDKNYRFKNIIKNEIIIFFTSDNFLSCMKEKELLKEKLLTNFENNYFQNSLDKNACIDKLELYKESKIPISFSLNYNFCKNDCNKCEDLTIFFLNRKSYEKRYLKNLANEHDIIISNFRDIDENQKYLNVLDIRNINSKSISLKIYQIVLNKKELEIYNLREMLLNKHKYLKYICEREKNIQKNSIIDYRKKINYCISLNEKQKNINIKNMEIYFLEEYKKLKIRFSELSKKENYSYSNLMNKIINNQNLIKNSNNILNAMIIKNREDFYKYYKEKYNKNLTNSKNYIENIPSQIKIKIEEYNLEVEKIGWNFAIGAVIGAIIGMIIPPIIPVTAIIGGVITYNINHNKIKEKNQKIKVDFLHDFNNKFTLFKSNINSTIINENDKFYDNIKENLTNEYESKYLKVKDYYLVEENLNKFILEKHEFSNIEIKEIIFKKEEN